jgi:hypothetical protein
MEGGLLGTLRGVDASSVERLPFPHVVSSIPETAYAALEAALPNLEELAPDGDSIFAYRTLVGYTIGDRHYSASAEWNKLVADTDFHALYARLCEIFGVPPGVTAPEQVKPRFRDDSERIGYDVMLQISTDRYRAHPPHTESQDKRFVMLMYLPAAGDVGNGGDLQLYSVKPDAMPHETQECLEPAADIPYAPNTVIWFMNGRAAFHGATARAEGAPAQRLCTVVFQYGKDFWNNTRIGG